MGLYRALIVLLLAGCGSVPPASIPVAVSCVQLDQLPQRPEVRSEVTLMSMNRYHRTLAVWEERLLVIDYADTLRAMLLECAR